VRGYSDMSELSSVRRVRHCVCASEGPRFPYYLTGAARLVPRCWPSTGASRCQNLNSPAQRRPHRAHAGMGYLSQSLAPSSFLFYAQERRLGPAHCQHGSMARRVTHAKPERSVQQSAQRESSSVVLRSKHCLPCCVPAVAGQETDPSATGSVDRKHCLPNGERSPEAPLAGRDPAHGCPHQHG
jgi:hypothetical protein